LGINAGTSILSGVLGANAAGNAASTQANAATQAAQLQYQASQNALGFAQNVYNQQQGQAQPWIQAGQGAVTNLAYLLGIPMQQAAQVAQQNPQLAQQASTVGQYAGAGNNLPANLSGGTIPNGMGGPAYSGGISPEASAANPRPNEHILPDAATGTSPAASTATSTVPVSGGSTVPLSGLSGTSTPTGINPALGAFGSLSTPWTQQFNAPTDVTEQNDPGYQFRLAEGQKALERSAAAKGGLLSGGTAKALDRYGQDYASGEYGNVYNRALGEYQQNYNIFQQNQSNLYNRLSGLAGLGQVSAGQLNSAGQNYSNNAGNLLIGGANAQAAGLNNAASARASGYIGGTNATTGALSGLGNLATLASVLYPQIAPH